MKRYDKTILVTGGAGFIGSHVIRHFVNKYPNYRIICFDAFTYAGNIENLQDLNDKENLEIIYGDITSTGGILKRHNDEPHYRLDGNVYGVDTAFEEFGITDVIHLAAESHVDRSIIDPTIFGKTNIMGTLNLLNAAKKYWNDDYSKHRFHHVSTDEVYGSLDMDKNKKFTESTPYSPHSPYSASKAASDFLVKAYHDTFGLNVTISNCSNNYGPNQFPEKLIPYVIYNIKEGKDVPVYGTGENIRDWLYVEDHAVAIDTIFHNGRSGETYNVGGNTEMSNLDVIKRIMLSYCKLQGLSIIEINCKYDKLLKTIKFVSDRAGHDLRYAIDCSKLTNELGWQPKESFDTGIEKTVKWYLDNEEWLNHCSSGEYKKWIETNYDKRI